jgi:hypothetical protein
MIINNKKVRKPNIFSRMTQLNNSFFFIFLFHKKILNKSPEPVKETLLKLKLNKEIFKLCTKLILYIFLIINIHRMEIIRIDKRKNNE